MKRDYNNVGAICDNCARSAGFVRKDKVVGVWEGECEICHKHKPCTDLWHDWVMVGKKKAGNK